MAKKRTFFILLIIGSLFLCACGGTAATPKDGLNSPEAAAECVMNSLKTMDLDTFNKYTDNYISTQRNFIGIPKSREYRVFNELLQPALFKGTHYKRNYRLSQRFTQNLSWEITDVRESDKNAEIDIKITNLDMSLATGNYIASIFENMSESEGIGIGSLIRDMLDLAGNMDGFLSAIDSLDSGDTCTIAVTLSAFYKDGKWKLHVSDEFIHAFMGYPDSEEYPEEVIQKIEALELEIENKAEDWAEDFEIRADTWAEEFEDRMEGLFD